MNHTAKETVPTRRERNRSVGILPAVRREALDDTGTVYGLDLMPDAAAKKLVEQIKKNERLNAFVTGLKLSGSRPLRLILTAGDAWDAEQTLCGVVSLLRTMRAENKAEDTYSETIRELLGDEEPQTDGLVVIKNSAPPAGNNDPHGMMCAMERGKNYAAHLKTGGHVLLDCRTYPLTEELYHRIARAEEADVIVLIDAANSNRALEKRLAFEMQFARANLKAPDSREVESRMKDAAARAGIALAADVEAASLVAELRSLRRSAYTVGDLYSLMRCAARWCSGEKAASRSDLMAAMQVLAADGGSAMEELNAMVGLENVKEAVRLVVAGAAHCAQRVRMGLPAPQIPRNMAFMGAPGTGKSVTAELVARALAEVGVGDGVFVNAGRQDIVGEYLGHTSPKIAALFERARGGVLFVDEAGALIPEGNDSYATEAVNAFVRLMELHPEVTVIFATYEPEMQRLMHSNAGLSSRVSIQLKFESYTDRQMMDILRSMAQKNGYTMTAEAEKAAERCFKQLRRCKKEDFGNGREARRLLYGAIQQLALRNGGPEESISAEDMEKAARGLLDGCSKSEKAAIGF